MHEIFGKAKSTLRRQTIKLRRSALQESRKQFFETMEMEDINGQLDPLSLSLDKDIRKPDVVRHYLEE